jgi:hypothetical protein
MDLAPLEISETEAKEKLAEYEAALRVERNAEDEAIAMGYRAAARGLPVIRLANAIARGGWTDDTHGLPRIAIARATDVECYVQWNGDALIYQNDVRWNVNRGALVGQHSVRVPMRNVAVPTMRSWHRGHTLVPLIPPRHRPKPRRLKHCHILWEVEQWLPIPAKDPALLRHIRGDLWAVLATWDLTDLERYVLSQR